MSKFNFHHIPTSFIIRFQVQCIRCTRLDSEWFETKSIAKKETQERKWTWNKSCAMCPECSLKRTF